MRRLRLEAKALAGLPFGGLDSKIGRELGGTQAMGVEHPETHDQALVIGAFEIAADEAVNLVKQIGAFIGQLEFIGVERDFRVGCFSGHGVFLS